MKPTTIKTPALEHLYNQKYQYEQHKQKLFSIYKQRRSFLAHNRETSFQEVRNNRNRSFVNRFNYNHAVIAKENQRFAGKLEAVRASVRVVTSQEKLRNTHSYITPFLKTKLLNTEKENFRMNEKIKSLSSSLNQKIFVKDYAKSQKIKVRLMKYESEDSRIVLKSERYLHDNEESHSHSQSHNLTARPKKSKQNNQQNKQEHNARKSVASHYRREEITKNKIDVGSSSLAGIKARAKDRINSSLEVNKIQDNEQNNFFTTQPNKAKKIGPKKVFL